MIIPVSAHIVNNIKLFGNLLFDNLLFDKAELSMLFQTITGELNNNQLNFLKAVLNKVKQLSSVSTIAEYQPETSANVIKIKKALINKEIIDIQNDVIEFHDPL